MHSDGVIKMLKNKPPKRDRLKEKRAAAAKGFPVATKKKFTIPKRTVSKGRYL